MVTPRQLHFVKLRLEVYIFVSGQTTGFIASLGFFSYIFRPRFSTFSCHRLLHRSQTRLKNLSSINIHSLFKDKKS